MRLDRAAKFGLFGSIGFIVIGLGMFAMIEEIQSGVEAGTIQGDLTILIVLVGGTTVGMVFLFILIGEYIDRMLEGRRLATSEE